MADFPPTYAWKDSSPPAGDADEGITLVLVSPGSCMTHDVADVAITLRFVKRRVWRLMSAEAGDRSSVGIPHHHHDAAKPHHIKSHYTQALYTIQCTPHTAIKTTRH